jgi:CO dehydrogenase/acetyl-CoA synthase beta subunit
MKPKSIMTKIQFVAQITTQGDNRVVWIPKRFHDKINKMIQEDKQVKIIIDDEI